MTDARFLDPDMLSAYLDGELDQTERAAVYARLAESPEWRAELDEVGGARTMLRAVAARDAPPGFWDAVLTGVAADADLDADDAARVTAADPGAATVASIPARIERENEREKSRGPGRWIATAFAAAAAVVLAVIIVPHRGDVSPDVTAVVVQHGAQGSEQGDPVSTITPVGPLAGFRR